MLVKDLTLDYFREGDRWEGGALLVPSGDDRDPTAAKLDMRPPPTGAGGPGAGIGLAGGDISHAGADLDFGSYAPQLFPGVFLQHIRFAIDPETNLFYFGQI